MWLFRLITTPIFSFPPSRQGRGEILRNVHLKYNRSHVLLKLGIKVHVADVQFFFRAKVGLIIWLAATLLKVYVDAAPTVTPSTVTFLIL